VSWLAPAIVAILSGSVILSVVFLYLYVTERERWMGIWGVAWLAYTIRFAVDLYQVLTGSDAVALGLTSSLLVLVTGVLLLEGTYVLAGRGVPRWHRYLGGVVAAGTAVGTLLGVPPIYALVIVWVFRGLANIAAGVVWYRHITDAGAWGKITAVTFVVWGIHNLDYPLTRGIVWFAPIGFMLGAFLEFILAFGALISHFERTRRLLAHSETSFRLFAENARDVIFRTRLKPEYAMEYIGPSIERLTGYPPAHFIESPDASIELVHPEDRGVVIAAMGGDVLEVPWLCRWLHRDGHVVWTEQQLVAVRDANGTVIRVEGIARDVTDRVLAEQAASRSELRYRALFERSASVMLLVDPDEGVIADLNDAAVAYYGWSREQLLGMPMSEINTLSADQINVEMAAARAQRRNHFFFRHRRAGGDVRDVEVYSGPVPYDDRVLLFSIVHDITDRREMLRDLAESEERYVAVFRDSLSPMLLVDPTDARIVDANAAAAGLYGMSASALTTLTIGDLSTDTIETIAGEIQATLERGGHFGTFRHHCADDTIRDVEVYATPIVSRGRTLLYTIVHDITQRSQAERELAVYRQHLEEVVAERTEELTRANAALERASQAKDEYLANMSHELRTPLNSVIGFSSLLMRGMAGELNDEQVRQVDMINTAGQHLLGVVDGILDLARIEAGRIEADLEPTDVSMLCTKVADGAGPLAAARGIVLAAEIPEGVEAVTDPTLLEQIVWNLVGNGIKFTDEGEVTLVLTASENSFTIVVSDTGRGLRSEDRDRVFETFLRIEGADGTRTEGSGLGLPITKRLVRVLGGTIDLESELGRGSVFTVVIPR
jgi:PAS domain S-box-containing protein